MKRYFSFDNFRAIAIIMIVFSHCIFFFDNTGNTVLPFSELLVINFIGGATFFFVFITGFLTPKVFYKKYDYKTFFSQKLKKLLPPYIILSLPMIFLFIYFNKGIFLDYPPLEQFLLYLTTGVTFAAYWYIPFIILIFALYPLFRSISNSPNLMIVLAITLSLFSLYIQRPINNINVFHSVIYYIPVYFIGSIVAKYDSFFSHKLLIPLTFSLFIFFLFIESYLGHNGNYHSNFFDFNGIDIMFLQKLFLTLFIFSLFQNYFNIEIPSLKKIADYSFGIFFIHMLIIFIISYSNKWLNLPSSFLTFLIISFLVLFLSIIIIRLTQIVFKNNSKYLIGV